MSKLVATYTNSDIILSAPSKKTQEQYPDIPEDYLLVLIKFCEDGFKDVFPNEVSIMKLVFLDTIIKNYQEGKIYIEKGENKYKIYEK